MTRVLIVDDKEENIYYLNALLTAEGHEVESARHGVEALAKARLTPPSVVISDLLMPVMDGYTLLRHWKADERLKRIPFIVYTATYTDPEDERLALNLGADAFILKPAEPSDFLARLRAVEANAVASVPVSAPPAPDETAFLKQYSETLVRKLEQKIIQLEESNRRLQEDIAARQLAEKARDESNNRLSQLAESIDDVFWLEDLDTQQVIYVSPAYQSIWGHSPASLYAAPRSWLDAVHTEDRQHVQASLSHQTQGTWDETYRIVRPDGSIRWIRSRAYPVRNANNQVYRLAGVSRDVTEYRRLEEQFRHAQKMEAVGRLAGGIAHDFNNLLSVVLSFAGLVRDALKPGDPLRGDISEVYRAGERGRDLTKQLLAFSRQQLLAPQVVALDRTVLDMEKMLRRLVGKDIALAIVASPSAGKVHADPSQIEQIVMNLAINASDAMPGGGQLTIEIANVELDGAYAARVAGLEPGPYVMLAVTDTGAGMDAATRERIFEPFFTTKPLGKGTGLGLSTVFGIVKQSQGHIDVYSEVGIGTTFRVYLRRTDRAIDMAPAAQPAPTTLHGSETVLLVEDDDQVREASRAILQRHGYRVLVARNGGEACTMSEAFPGPVNLLLTDVVMQGMSGRVLAERLGPLRPELKILYVSGYTETSIVHHGVLAPGIEFLAKPITPERLLRKVREVLDKNGSGAQPVNPGSGALP